VKKIGFVTNLNKDPQMHYTKQLIDLVKENGCISMLSVATGELEKEPTVTIDQMYSQADFVVVLGGDGTILRVARSVAKYDVPLLGINIGTLGYLADCERNDAKEAIENAIRGNFKIEERMMLEARVERNGEMLESNVALNEISVVNSVFSRVIKLALEINEDYISSYRSDGIIVATPTGSTAYSLSAGGPILKPDTKLMAITYVCPHSLTARPFVVSGDDIVKIKVESSYGNAVINLDGQESMPLANGDVVTIQKSDYITKTIRTTKMSFYDILRNKMLETD